MDTQKNKLSRFIPYIIPVIGVLFFEWNAFTVLLFFCVENILQGIFFLMRGVILVRYGGSAGFLIVFCLLYFAHAIGMTWAVIFLGNELSNHIIPPWYIILANLVILVVPYVYDFIWFSSSMNKIGPIALQAGVSKKAIVGQEKTQDLAPVLSFILNIKEMFLRVFTIWITLPLIFPIIFVGALFKLPDIVGSLVVICVFSVFHYICDSKAENERQKYMEKYTSWKATK